MGEPAAILYLAGCLPTRSETFVYREVFALRELGVRVRTASVHAPARALDDGPLEALAAETLAIYPRGVAGILADAAAELAARPARTAGTIARAVRDAITADDARGLRRAKVLWQALAALSLARRVRPDRIAHVHAHMAHVPATIAMYAARQLGIGFSFTGHANDLFPNRSLLRPKLARAAWVQCISRWHRDFYRSIVPRPDEDYPVVRCGVDTRLHTPPPPSDRPELAVLAVGRLVEKKGFDVLIEAAGDLARAGGPPVRVRIAGGGEEEARLRRLVDSLPPGASVELLGDTPNDRVMELMGEADLFVIPCRVAASGDRDGIPVVLMEAMSFGLPVIAGDLPAIRELVDGAGTGLLATPGDAASVADAVARVLRDRAMAERLGAGGRRRVEEEFGERTNVLRLSSAIEAASRATPAPARTDGIGPGL